jgi:mRNA interferase MazF
MPRMTDYKFGDVVLIPFPFTDQTSVKKRPAVVVSSTAYHHSCTDLVLMPITSRIKPAPSFGVVTVAQWETADLIKPSIINPIFVTIEEGLVIRKIGKLQAEDQQRLKTAIQTILG